MSARIALLGAPGTGKSQLATAIADHLRAHGLHASIVPDVLHEGRTREARMPRPEEHLAIAQEQERRVDLASGEHDLVIADTTALMAAIRAGQREPDGDLLRFATERQRTYDLTLVTGLDLPPPADTLHRDAQPREQCDALLRALLQAAAIPYQVVYGIGSQRLESALTAMAAAGLLPADMRKRAPDADTRRAWQWNCEKCSDPACEHRLFTQLREARN